MKRLVIASLMVVKDALGSLPNLTNLALLSMMKSGEFLSMMTSTNSPLLRTVSLQLWNNNTPQGLKTVAVNQVKHMYRVAHSHPFGFPQGKTFGNIVWKT
ncbi:hypothetical protein Bca4012_024423 [Brassica carinata]